MHPVPRACSGAGGISTGGESARFRASSNNSSAPARDCSRRISSRPGSGPKRWEPGRSRASKSTWDSLDGHEIDLGLARWPRNRRERPSQTALRRRSTSRAAIQSAWAPALDVSTCWSRLAEAAEVNGSADDQTQGGKHAVSGLPLKGTAQIRVEIHAKDTDANNLAASQACQAAKERLRLGEVGKSISITVLRLAHLELGGVDLDLP